MNDSAQTKVVVVGASGYSGEELVRLLLGHPFADLVAVTSRQYAGQPLAKVFPRFAQHPKAKNLAFIEPKSESIAQQSQAVFLALPHGVAAEMASSLAKSKCRIIDISADFRLKSAQVYDEFYGHKHPAPELLKESIYGLPEFYRNEIKRANLVACPGCYPTSILMPLIPLLRAKLINPSSIIADSLSGISGAGRKLDADYLFAECNESMRPYGLPKHRHLSEIEQELSLAAGQNVVIQFTPHLVPLNRGILTTLYLLPAQSISEMDALNKFNEGVADCLQSAYSQEPFVRILTGNVLPDTKNVSGTNLIEIAWRLDPRTGRLIIMSALDNLVKGASGQALQCFNIMFGYPETTGLI